jgi:beta-glucosidase
VAGSVATVAEDDLERPFTLPRDFVFGAATSAYQIEGAWNEDGKGPSIWDTFAHQPGRMRAGDTGDVAIDHYHRMPADVRLLAELGLDAYSFSISWPRVLPEGSGRLNRAGVGFYDRLVDELLDAGLQPCPTLFHWDLPQALQDAGGWPRRETAERFADYAAAVTRVLGDRVSTWATLNEPWCAAYLGHYAGFHAPGVRDARAAIASAHHLLLAHGLAVAAMRAQSPAVQVGIVLNPAPVRAFQGVGDEVVRLVDGLRNRWFLDAVLAGRYPDDVLEAAGDFATEVVQPDDLAVIGAPTDWMGVNYYHDLQLVAAGEDEPSPYPFVPPVLETGHRGDTTDLGWPITPEGLTETLTQIHSDYPDHPPLVLTENGAAYDDPVVDGRVADDRRISYLAAHLHALEDAIAKGVDVRGYMVWSAFDNLEWHNGYAMRFGLVHVDLATQARTPRASAWWLRDVIEAHRAVA